MFSLHKTFLFLILTLSKDPTCQPLGGIPCVWVQTKTPLPSSFVSFFIFLLPPPPKVPAGPALISLQPQVRMRRSPTLERPNVFQ